MGGSRRWRCHGGENETSVQERSRYGKKTMEIVRYSGYRRRVERVAPTTPTAAEPIALVACRPVAPLRLAQWFIAAMDDLVRLLNEEFRTEGEREQLILPMSPNG